MADPGNTVSRTWDKPFQVPDSIPASADVVIIGGGIVGVSAAWFLARQGISVTLCEKGHIAGEQSGRNWGWVRQTARDSREMPMMIESMRIWAGLAEEIGEDVGFERGGAMIMARDQKELNDAAEWMSIARDYDLDTQVVEGAALESLFAGASKRWVGALHTASDGRAEPHKATPAISRAAERHGATILTSCAVRGIETSGGRVSAVVTEHGTIRTSQVLCAAGAWTSLFCRSLGISVPQLKVKGTVVRLGKCDNVLNGNAYDDQLGIRRRQDGGYTAANGFLLHHSIALSTFRYGIKFIPALMLEFKKLRLSIGGDLLDEIRTPKKWSLDRESPFEKQRVLNPPPSQRVIKKTRRAIDRLFPKLASTQIVEAWAGIVETSPDMVPVMCESEKIGGFFMATGFSGHGFGIGPGAGKAAAEMLTNADGAIDLSEFHLKRFFDGSPIRPQSSV
jgi:glycine/D-amino acid oxidase-like deaminating enzyme